ncbi:hypothetical protein PtA15_2A211 [Puccinia triticina]|uniref:Uncharacterized protein n=1 Tax=Puccinia triticina TaxID=208348 RepID=A0ABY7CBY6_9BASI|nr:uncharacterized protein PtA15_2A211 [Puccinia triticina]WAQ81898.1 hypothetical protein PtA15_2A211 [Puccinia triticina]
MAHFLSTRAPTNGLATAKVVQCKWQEPPFLELFLDPEVILSTAADCPTRVSKPLAPHKLSAIEHYFTLMGIQKVNPLQRAIPAATHTPASERMLQSLGPKLVDHTKLSSNGVDSSYGCLRFNNSLDLAPIGASKLKPLSGTTLPLFRALFGNFDQGLLPVSAVSSPGLPAQSGSFKQTGRSTTGRPKLIHPLLMNLTASFSWPGQKKTAGNNTETGDLLVPSSLAHKLLGHNKDKLEQTGKQLISLIHSLIMRINEAHWQTILAQSAARLAPSYPFYPSPNYLVARPIPGLKCTLFCALFLASIAESAAMKFIWQACLKWHRTEQSGIM